MPLWGTHPGVHTVGDTCGQAPSSCLVEPRNAGKHIKSTWRPKIDQVDWLCWRLDTKNSQKLLESFDFISKRYFGIGHFIFIGPRWKRLEVYLQDVLQQQGIASLALVGELRETMDVLSRFGCQGEPRVGGLRSQTFLESAAQLLDSGVAAL